MLIVMRWPVGGIRTFCRYVYNHFDNNRFRFTILAPELDELKVLAKDLKDYEIKWVAIKYSGNVYNRLFLGTMKCINRDDVDIIHSHGISAGLLCSIPAKLFSIPHLMTSHDSFNDNQFSGIIGVIKKATLIAGLILIDKIHYVSHEAKKNFYHHLPLLKRFEDKSFVARNGIMISQFHISERRNFQEELKLDPKTFLVGFMGRFMAPKGFRYLIDAVEIIDRKENVDFPFKVICFGWGGFIREEQNMIRRKRLSNYFIFLPFTSNVAVSLKGLNVLAIPSLWEACPLIPMEAMVAGVPVIGTDCRGLREIMTDNKLSARKIPSRDSRALADAILDEMKSPSIQNAMKYVDRAISLFDVKAQAKIIEKRVLSLLKF
ncbi:glycosyltransferase family 4 protein [Desulfoluna limicola]|nr:glycosyltransferase family 4 protein [Desulfoluna limicola]